MLTDLLEQINNIEEQKAGKDMDRIISDIIRGIEALCMESDSSQVGYTFILINHLRLVLQEKQFVSLLREHQVLLFVKQLLLPFARSYQMTTNALNQPILQSTSSIPFPITSFGTKKRNQQRETAKYENIFSL
jgi:hypothetical protein